MTGVGGVPQHAQQTDHHPEAPRLSRLGRFVQLSRLDRFGALYLLVVIIVLFSILAPSSFPTWDTAKSVLNENATIAILSLALVVPLATGVFDLSIGNVVALISVAIAWLVVERHIGVGLSIIIALAMAAVVGLVNALIVIGLGIDSFIGTLGTGAVLQAVNLLISNDETVSSPHLSNTLTKIAITNVAGLQVPVLVAIGTALIIWWLLDHTVTGRRLYATGFSPEAARLAGVRVKRLRAMGLVFSGFVAGVSGLMVTARVGAGSPDIGPPYLLDAFAAAFLGATQIRNGRFNAWGTIVAVLVLGTGTNGLTQIGAAAWTLQMYTGLVLIVALTLTRLERRQVRAGKASPHGHSHDNLRSADVADASTTERETTASPPQGGIGTPG